MLAIGVAPNAFLAPSRAALDATLAALPAAAGGAGGRTADADRGAGGAGGGGGAVDRALGRAGGRRARPGADGEGAR